MFVLLGYWTALKEVFYSVAKYFNMEEQEQIVVSGGLLNFTIFEDKLMRNFLAISNRLKKLQGVMDLDQRIRALEKDHKFVAMKVDNLVEKMPKDANKESMTRKDVRTISKELLFEVLNSGDQQLKQSKFSVDLETQLAKLRDEQSERAVTAPKDSKDKRHGSRTSFTAAQIMRDAADCEKPKTAMPKESLEDCLDPKELELVSGIVESKQEEKKQVFGLKQMRQKLEELAKVVDQLRLGRGYASFLQREQQKFQKFQEYEQKSKHTSRKQREKPIKLEGIRHENVKAEVMRQQLLSDVQKMEMSKQELARQQLMQKKTIYSHNFITGEKEHKQPVLQPTKEFKRSHSIKKLDRLERRLKVDDLKDLNSVLREIQLRIETRVTHDVFMGFVKDFEEKLQVLRLTKDSSSDINELRKAIFVIEGKVQSVISYLQSIAQEDEALLVKKQWTCISCDKALDKYQAKVGQHLNWDSMNSKKISPNKAGAFGQTGQLATKIRNLMDGDAQ